MTYSSFLALKAYVESNKTLSGPQPPRSPNCLAQSSYSFKPSLFTLGLIVRKLARKSSKPIGRISSIVMCSNASPNDRSGPIAASFARAVMSEPENPSVSCLLVIGTVKKGRELTVRQHHEVGDIVLR